MSTSFRFVALPYAPFASYFDVSDRELHEVGARRIVVDEKPGFPCRVSLADAEVGETVALVPFTHHDVSSPYRGSGPIFVRRDVETASPAAGEVPLMFRHRLLSIRAYDVSATLITAEVVKGSQLDATIRRLFADDRVDYLHVHNAGPGCFNCRVERA
jgi:hypothetical protein